MPQDVPVITCSLSLPAPYPETAFQETAQPIQEYAVPHQQVPERDCPTMRHCRAAYHVREQALLGKHRQEQEHTDFSHQRGHGTRFGGNHAHIPRVIGRFGDRQSELAYSERLVIGNCLGIMGVLLTGDTLSDAKLHIFVKNGQFALHKNASNKH